MATVEITILVCTYNRANDLRELLASALDQQTEGAFRYEILVVDNNSSDETRAVAEAAAASGDGKVRYLFEARQGRSYALNTGLGAARGEICAIADDDLVLPPEYLRGVWETFSSHPGISLVGGKVLPVWKDKAPRWMDRRHWCALALGDWGDEPFATGRNRPVCLLAAAFRKRDVVAAGGYNPELGVSKDVVGGAEDADIYGRMYRAGCSGRYEPSLWLRHKVEPDRLTKRYHRRWHFGHGRQLARMRDPAMERSRFHVLGVPVHLLRRTLAETAGYLTALSRRDAARAFWHACQLYFVAGFVRERLRAYRAL